MGLSSKRRGGSAGSTHSSGSGGSGSGSGGGSARDLPRSNKVRNKDRERVDRDQHSGSDSVLNKKRRMGGRRGNTVSPPPMTTNSSSSHHHHNDVKGISKKQRRELDPTVLARGMSSRMVGARISQHLTILNPEDTEKDLRHMEAYANACTAYSQQFFIFHNRPLVQSGHFGPVSAPGLTAIGGGTNATGGADGVNGGGPHSPGQTPGLSYNDGTPSRGRQGAGASRGPHHTAAQFAMPVRIDPEEEKRVANLRKKIAASEAQREVLEAEYMSLRAHFVNESQRLKRTRQAVDGQLKLLQELILKRGKALALRRVRCAAAKDILACLKRRAMLLDLDVEEAKQQEVVSTSTKKQDPSSKTAAGKDSAAEASMAADNDAAATVVRLKSSDDAMDIDGPSTTTADAVDEPSTEEAVEPEFDDVLDVWNEIEEQLANAERECFNISLPQDLLPDSAISAPPSSSSNGKKKASKSSNSKDKDSDNNSTSKKKQRRSVSSGNASATSDDDSTSKKDLDSDSNSAKDVVITSGNDEDVVIWESQIMPRTPYGIPIYLSHLSAVPDKAAAYGVGGLFGSNQSTMVWLEANLPETYNRMSSEHDTMLRLQEDVQYLSDELDKERNTNKNLQKQIIESRKRSDEMCALMTVMRSETEAVLNRHNTLLETKEARAAAEALYKQAVKERRRWASEDYGDVGDPMMEMEMHRYEMERMEMEVDRRRNPWGKNKNNKMAKNYENDGMGQQVHEDDYDNDKDAEKGGVNEAEDHSFNGSGKGEHAPPTATVGMKESNEIPPPNDDDNDGDDEDEPDEDEEEDGEILE